MKKSSVILAAVFCIVLIVGCGGATTQLEYAGDTAQGKATCGEMTFSIPGGYKAILLDDIGTKVDISIVEAGQTGETTAPTVLISIQENNPSVDYSEMENTESTTVNGQECIIQKAKGSSVPIYIFQSTPAGTIFIDGRNTANRENAEEISKSIAESVVLSK